MEFITKVMLLFGILRVTMSSTSMDVPKKSYVERDAHTYEPTWHQTEMKVNIGRIIDLLDLSLGDMVSNIIVENS